MTPDASLDIYSSDPSPLPSTSFLLSKGFNLPIITIAWKTEDLSLFLLSVRPTVPGETAVRTFPTNSPTNSSLATSNVSSPTYTTGISSTTTLGRASSTVVSCTTASCHSAGLNAGARAGVGVGIAILVLLLILSLIFMIRLKRQRHMKLVVPALPEL